MQLLVEVNYVQVTICFYELPTLSYLTAFILTQIHSQDRLDTTRRFLEYNILDIELKCINESDSGNKTPTMVGMFSFANLLIVEEKLEKLGPQYVSLSVKLPLFQKPSISLVIVANIIHFIHFHCYY